jgi:hypothetical protein
MIYLLLAFTYVLLLPNYNLLLRNGYYYPRHHLVAKASVSTAAHHARVQKLFYATPESKKDVFAGVLLTGAVCATFFTIIIGAIQRLFAPRGDLAYYAISHRHAYLQFRSLRI